MEYGIYFENENANKTILEALEELNNNFFIEISSSESEKNTSDDDENVLIVSEDENFERLDEIHLINFEFVENSDNYIEDKVYEDLKLKVKELFKSGKCSCHPKCYEKIGYERFLERRMEFESLDKKMRDMVIKGQLMAFQKDENTKKVAADNRKYLRFNYNYNHSISICRTTYEMLVGVGHKYIDAIIKHLREHGLEERIHGNTGKVPKNMNRVEVNYNVSCEIYGFLKNYSNVHGIPSPGWHFNKISSSVIFLPTNYNYDSVYRDYV